MTKNRNQLSNLSDDGGERESTNGIGTNEKNDGFHVGENRRDGSGLQNRSRTEIGRVVVDELKTGYRIDLDGVIGEMEQRSQTATMRIG